MSLDKYGRNETKSTNKLSTVYFSKEIKSPEKIIFEGVFAVPGIRLVSINEKKMSKGRVFISQFKKSGMYDFDGPCKNNYPTVNIF